MRRPTGSKWISKEARSCPQEIPEAAHGGNLPLRKQQENAAAAKREQALALKKRCGTKTLLDCGSPAAALAKPACWRRAPPPQRSSPTTRSPLHHTPPVLDMDAGSVSIRDAGLFPHHACLIPSLRHPCNVRGAVDLGLQCDEGLLSEREAETDHRSPTCNLRAATLMSHSP